jgi:hypothetical protein
VKKEEAEADIADTGDMRDNRDDKAESIRKQ